MANKLMNFYGDFDKYVVKEIEKDYPMFRNEYAGNTRRDTKPPYVVLEINDEDAEITDSGPVESPFVTYTIWAQSLGQGIKLDDRVKMILNGDNFNVNISGISVDYDEDLQHHAVSRDVAI